MDGVTAPDPRMPDMPSDAERSRGRYVHVRDGGPAGVDERWVAGDVGGGAVRIRSTRVSSSPTSRLEVDVRLAGPASSAVLRWTGSGDGVVRAATAECVAVGGLVEVRRVVDGTAYQPVLVDSPLVLPALVLGGLLVQGAASAFVVGDARDPEAFLVPVPVLVEFDAAEAIEVDGDAATALPWRISGGIALAGDDVVDTAGLLRRRTTGGVTASLAEVTGPPLRPAAWQGDGLLLG